MEGEVGLEGESHCGVEKARQGILTEGGIPSGRFKLTRYSNWQIFLLRQAVTLCRAFPKQKYYDGEEEIKIPFSST